MTISLSFDLFYLMKVGSLCSMENGVLGNPRVRRTISIHCSGVSCWGPSRDSRGTGSGYLWFQTDELATYPLALSPACLSGPVVAVVKNNIRRFGERYSVGDEHRSCKKREEKRVTLYRIGRIVLCFLFLKWKLQMRNLAAKVISSPKLSSQLGLDSEYKKNFYSK